tara:strand:- start:6976 stop:7263 length:288 start_codon:yes stop_codon:yes gene_type:complete
MADDKMTKLRLFAFMRANNQCEWADCNSRSQLQLAHIQAKGMGGSDSRKYDPENVAVLCMTHHDIYDGRKQQGSSYAVRMLLTAYLKGKWNDGKK